MKKTLKLISLVLVVIMIGSLFCGCDALDELRASVATMTETGDIKLGDNIYKKLPETESLRIDYEQELKYVYIADKETPILLAPVIGVDYMTDKTGILLTSYETEENVFYCRSDYYEQIKEQIENGFKPSKYYYEYYKIADDDFEGDYIKRALSEEELNALKTVLSGKGKVLADNMNVLCDYIATIEYCSEDGYFYDYYCDVYIYNNTYTVVVQTENKTKTFEVPKKMNNIFKNMVEEFVQNEQLWNE